ncbi:death-on-curing family protein [Pyrolobus fumarii 1A]|uniref:Death-on-curing family protein n=1 Tax=Pyrolobus fumarii (strain DSM 11204 / 1A) TaxID=694429 RepID=G0EGM1_PYRF1|nr:type II toxin-antitoxin system death-on-curing family toxin [Pyrolobus fumarii]AEM38395.1 death-on-curing family protein [Pyrolobus fumarii 1A]
MARKKVRRKRCVIRYPSVSLLLYIVEELCRHYPRDHIAVVSVDALESILESARYAARYTRSSCRVKKIIAAATLFYEAITRHPLTDGNKRFAVVLLRAFLKANRVRQPASAYEAAIRVARGEWSIEDLIEWLQHA